MWSNINRVKLYYTDSGNSEGIPVIFIHGFPFDHTIWDRQAEALPERFRAITYDVRGHGKSSAENTHFSIELFVDDLFELISKLELNKPVVCGISMGGYIILRAIERNPEAFRAIILCDTRSESDSDEAKINRAGAVKSIINNGVSNYAEASVKNLFWEENVKNNFSEVKRIRETIEKIPANVLCGTQMALAARTDTTDNLRNIIVPALIINGDFDKITPPIAAESLHENISGSDLALIPEAGHLSNLENTEAFNLAMLNFLSKVK